jgi:hypothetical protein
VETYIRIIHKELNEKQQITDSRLKDINRAVEKLLSGLKQLELDNEIVTKGIRCVVCHSFYGYDF